MKKTIFAILLAFSFFVVFPPKTISQSSFCDFPSLSQIRSSFHPSLQLIVGNVCKIARMPYYEQRPILQLKNHSWVFYGFYAEVRVDDLIRINRVVKYPQKRHDIIKIALEENISWGCKQRGYKFLTLKSKDRINYLSEGEEYILAIFGDSGYRNHYSMYCPPNIRNLNSCLNFYVWPMRIEGDMVEVPVQYYGSNEIIRKKFKYEEIINLFKNTD